MQKGITVIIPTVGRLTLAMTLASITPQLNPEDAVVVISEGPNDYVQQAVRSFSECIPGPDWTYVFDFGENWGHPNRNLCLDQHVQTSHVWTIDDDDIATDTAFKSMREHMDDPWTIFRMHFGEGHFAKGLTLWTEERIVTGNIGTPMIFAPLSKARFGLGYMGDFAYCKELQLELGDPVWSEDLVALIRPAPERNI